MANSVDSEQFLKTGYQILEAASLEPLHLLRKQFFLKAKEIVGYDGSDMEDFFDNFHRFELQGSSLNDVRMGLINYSTKDLDVPGAIFDSFAGPITDLIGPDIVTQKSVNLVIQQPGDPEVVPTHTDSPGNSPFEIIVWLPFVDVHKTKSMYMLDRQVSDEAMERYKRPETGYVDYKKFAEAEGTNLEVPFGSACLFWPGLVHGVHLNCETETRWSLNQRYKNLFSPIGHKGLSEYFDLFRLSPLSRMALEYEKKAYG
jgi:sporadic carbohydrate cluster 2OG-Fe(II) oxygenase